MLPAPGLLSGFKSFSFCFTTCSSITKFEMNLFDFSTHLSIGVPRGFSILNKLVNNLFQTFAFSSSVLVYLPSSLLSKEIPSLHFLLEFMYCQKAFGLFFASSAILCSYFFFRFFKIIFVVLFLSFIYSLVNSDFRI